MTKQRGTKPGNILMDLARMILPLLDANGLSGLRNPVQLIPTGKSSGDSGSS